MSAAITARGGQFVRKCVQSFIKQNSFKFKQKACFHNTAFLYVTGTELRMPSLSPTMSEGTIVKWLKKEGDKIAAGDVLCDIQTDKAVVSLETEEEGVLAKILVPENTKDVPVGRVIALIVEEGEDWKSVDVPKGLTSSPESSPSSSDSNSEEETAVEGTVDGQELKMPSLSPTMSEGTIVKWIKKEGDTIAPGDVLCDIQTDKAVVSLECEEEGILAKILVQENTKDVPVGKVIALLVAEGEDWKSVRVPKSVSGSAPPSSAPSDKGSTKTEVTSDKTLLSFGPAVRLLLTLYGIKPEQVEATGRRGKLLKEDVLKYIHSKKLEPKQLKEVPLPSKSAGGPVADKAEPKHIPKKKDGRGYIDIDLSSMRKTIAKRLTESKTKIPHSYGYAVCTIDKVMSLRKKLKEDGVSVSLNDFIIKAVAVALQQCPAVNSHYVGDQVKHVNNIDISVAVATDAGLITPIVKDALSKGVLEISDTVRDLAKRARENKLQLHEFQGGSFTISNLGMFGILEFSAIINPPQTAILAIGGGRSVINIDGTSTTKMTITLSYDRRAIEEHEAAEFLEVVQQLLEEPTLMIMGHYKKAEKAQVEL